MKKIMVVFLSVFLSIFAHAGEGENKMVNVIITFDVKEDKLSSFLTIMNDVKENLIKVEGCMGVKIYNDAEDASVFTLVETWETKEKHTGHISKVVESGDWEFIASHLESDPVSSYFTQI